MKKLKEFISEDKDTEFQNLNKLDDVNLLKKMWFFDIKKLNNFKIYLLKKIDHEKFMMKGVKGHTTLLNKRVIMINKSRIKFIDDILKDKKKGEPIPDWVRK